MNVVTGPGRTAGARLVEHPDVAKVAFTGLDRGRPRDRRSASNTIKRVTLELGGKSANVIFADADLERAAASAPHGGVRQRRSRTAARACASWCNAPRVDRFLALLEPHVHAIAVGDPFSDETADRPADQRGPARHVSSFVPEGTPVAIRAPPRRPGLLVRADRPVPRPSR